MRNKRILALLLCVMMLICCVACSPPIEAFEYAGHYMGHAFAGYGEHMTDQYEKVEDFYYQPLTYARLFAEPSLDELMAMTDYDVYTAYFYPSFDGYVIIRMMLSKTDGKSWVVFNRTDNRWYAGTSVLRAHSVFVLPPSEAKTLLVSMDESFTQSQLEKLDRGGADGMDIFIRQISDGATASFRIWSPEEKENPAVCRLIKAMLDYAHGDAEYLHDYIGFK